MNRSDLPLIVIVGETASGKSALAMALADKFDGELICADSWTVYKGFDIGTAKPSDNEQAKITHHLLDIADPEHGYNVVEFQKQAEAAIADIQSRGKLPIMVGGTGLYIDSVLYRYQFLPAPAEDMRQQLSGLSLDELLERATSAGLDTTGIDLRNKRRIIRLIENKGLRPTKGDFRTNTLMLGIKVDREHLRDRIVRRVDTMLASGLQSEVEQLYARYGWEAEPMKGIGYREWQMFFDGTQTIELTRERIIAASMGLAKRQRTWFKRNDRIHWLPAANNQLEAVELVTTFIHT